MTRPARSPSLRELASRRSGARGRGFSRYIPVLAIAAFATACRDSHHASSPVPPTLTVIPVFTLSGTTTIERGECIGFRIQSDQRVFPSEPLVGIGSVTLDPSVYYALDADTIQVGFPCFFIGLGTPLGPLDVTVHDGVESWTASGGLDVVETTRLALGAAPASSDALADPDANLLDRDGDFDVFGWSAPADGLYAAEMTLDSADDPAFTPLQVVTGANYASFLDGERMLLVPAAAGEFWSEVADRGARGGTGWRYRFRVDPLPAPIPTAAPDVCDAALSTAGLFTLDLSTASPDLDPGCIAAAGNDRAIRIEVPAGRTLVAAARSDAADVALYVQADCATNVCLAAADTFGVHDTETVEWHNAGVADAPVWVVVDETSAPGGAVTLLLRIE